MNNFERPNLLAKYYGDKNAMPLFEQFQKFFLASS